MIKQNCRIENFNGFRFYEKDILIDDYIFSDDMSITVDVTYSSAGFGIVIMDSNGASLADKDSSYLFKIGYNEASAHYATKTDRELIRQVNCKEAQTIQEHLKFTLIKKGKKITVKVNDNVILNEYLKKSLDKYNIGYYSSSGNTINNISIAANVPNNWTVNMEETVGGYIKFSNDSFELSGCSNPAEIEQSNIPLKKGIYYFNTDNSENCDIECYITPSKEDMALTNIDDRFYDSKKNILNKKTGIFVLKEDSLVNVKFIGTCGKVKNIMISDHKNDSYVSTNDKSIKFSGSFIDVFLSSINKITWKGEVIRTPGDDSGISDNAIYGLILDNRTQIRPSDLDMSYKIVYDFEFNTENFEFTVKKDGKAIHEKGRFILRNLSNKITIFKNITANIFEMILYKKNGAIVNINIQDEYKRFINADINSPIIVTDEDGAPLDLSSSYRKSIYKDHERYVFTNWEREYFYPKKKLEFENKVINKQDSIILYGIKKGAKINLNKIYDVSEDNINSIDLMTREYDTIYEKDIIYIDRDSSAIYISDDDLEKYEMFIVDYLKDNSYCINYHYSKHSYELNISSTDNKNKVLYDSIDYYKEQNQDYQVKQVNDYSITNISGNINGYIVLRREI